ncbi:MAG: hypothetical protein AB7U75_22430 [Hyphomicrobiaceae bacterium]
MSIQSAVPADVPVVAAGSGWGFHLKYKQMTWWIWTAIALLLIAGLAEYTSARHAAMAIAGVQALIWLARYRSISHFPTQVRVAYAIWMAVSFIPVLTPMIWIQTAGTLLLVILGYCPLARMLLFLPANRNVSLTLQRAARIVFHPPTRGSVLEELKL